MERYRTTIILIAVLAALSGLAFFLQRNQPAPNATPTAVPARYVWQEQQDVFAIDVVSGTQHISLRKDLTTTVWSLLSPVKADADTFSVGSQADQLKALSASVVISGTPALSQYGLERPVLTTTVKMRPDASGRSAKHTLLVGNADIDGSGYYVKTTDAPTVYVVSNTVVEPLKSWAQSPPVAQPTPTPIKLTVVPASPTVKGGAAGTITATGTVTLTLPVTPTQGIAPGGTITTTAPGAANSTTPLPNGPVPTATAP